MSKCDLLPEDFLEKATIVEKIGSGSYSDVYLYKYNEKEYVIKDFTKIYINLPVDFVNSIVIKEIDALIKFSDLECVSKIQGICTKMDINNRILFLIILDNNGTMLNNYIENESIFSERLATAMEMISKISPFMILSKLIHFNHYDVSGKNILIDRLFPISLEKLQIDNPNKILTPDSFKDVNSNLEFDYSIIDFGISEFSLGEFKKIIPNSVYTIYWRPPEQFSNSLEIINKYRDEGDMWAFGLVFLELITGVRFFTMLGELNEITQGIFKKLVEYSIKNDNSHMSEEDIVLYIKNKTFEDLYQEDLRLDYERFILENCSIDDLDIIPENFKRFFKFSLQYNPEKRITIPQFQEIFSITQKMIDDLQFNSYLLPDDLKKRYLNDFIINTTIEIHLELNLPVQCLIFSLELIGRYLGLEKYTLEDMKQDNVIIDNISPGIIFEIVTCIYLSAVYLEIDKFQSSFYLAEQYLLSKKIIKEPFNLDHKELRFRNMLIKTYSNRLTLKMSQIIKDLKYYVLNWELIFILSKYNNFSDINELVRKLIKVPNISDKLMLPVSEWEIFDRYSKILPIILPKELSNNIDIVNILESDKVSEFPLLDKLQEEKIGSTMPELSPGLENIPVIMDIDEELLIPDEQIKIISDELQLSYDKERLLRDEEEILRDEEDLLKDEEIDTLHLNLKTENPSKSSFTKECTECLQYSTPPIITPNITSIPTYSSSYRIQPVNISQNKI